MVTKARREGEAQGAGRKGRVKWVRRLMLASCKGAQQELGLATAQVMPSVARAHSHSPPTE